MVASGPKMEFYFLSAKYPGAVNDARVLTNSTLYDDFEAGYRPFPNAVILGDSIYPRKPWLIPTVPQAPNNVQPFYRQVF